MVLCFARASSIEYSRLHWHHVGMYKSHMDNSYKIEGMIEMNETDYWRGVIVGAVSIMTLLFPLLAIVSLIEQLPMLYREIGIIIFSLSLIFTLRLLFYRVERFWRQRIDLGE